MQLRDLIEALSPVKHDASTKEEVIRQEILQHLFCGSNGTLDLNTPVHHVANDVLVYNDCWIIFSEKAQRPRKVFVVEKKAQPAPVEAAA